MKNATSTWKGAQTRSVRKMGPIRGNNYTRHYAKRSHFWNKNCAREQNLPKKIFRIARKKKRLNYVVACRLLAGGKIQRQRRGGGGCGGGGGEPHGRKKKPLCWKGKSGAPACKGQRVRGEKKTRTSLTKGEGNPSVQQPSANEICRGGGERDKGKKISPGVEGGKRTKGGYDIWRKKKDQNIWGGKKSIKRKGDHSFPTETRRFRRRLMRTHPQGITVGDSGQKQEASCRRIMKRERKSGKPRPN